MYEEPSERGRLIDCLLSGLQFESHSTSLHAIKDWQFSLGTLSEATRPGLETQWPGPRALTEMIAT